VQNNLKPNWRNLMNTIRKLTQLHTSKKIALCGMM